MDEVSDHPVHPDKALEAVKSAMLTPPASSVPFGHSEDVTASEQTSDVLGQTAQDRAEDGTERSVDSKSARLENFVGEMKNGQSMMARSASIGSQIDMNGEEKRFQLHLGRIVQSSLNGMTDRYVQNAENEDDTMHDSISVISVAKISETPAGTLRDGPDPVTEKTAAQPRMSSPAAEGEEELDSGEGESMDVDYNSGGLGALLEEITAQKESASSPMRRAEVKISKAKSDKAKGAVKKRKASSGAQAKVGAKQMTKSKKKNMVRLFV